MIALSHFSRPEQDFQGNQNHPLLNYLVTKIFTAKPFLTMLNPIARKRR